MLKVPPDGSRMYSDHAAPQDAVERAAREIAYQMAYGLSHELNNPLANIAARGRLLAESESDPHRRQQLSAIVDQAMRGCEMIADLMIYARPPQFTSQVFAVDQLVRRLVQRAGAGCAPNVQVNMAVSSNDQSWLVRADAQAIEESVWAVLRNASEAAQSRVEVELGQDAVAGEIVIAIVDDGPGLSPMALEHAFHPFFSGREAGRGIGLGLSKARRFLELQNGSVTIASGDSTGCRVRVSLKKEP